MGIVLTGYTTASLPTWSPKTALVNCESFFLIMLKAPLRSAFILPPLMVIYKPLCCLFPENDVEFFTLLTPALNSISETELVTVV